EPGKSELKPPADSCRTRGVKGFAKQAVAGRVLPDAVEGQRRYPERDPVEDDRGSLALAATKGPRQNRGGERKKRDGHEQQGVQEQYHPVRGTDVVEHDVVVRPYLPDEEEGHGIGEIGGPQPKKAVQQVAVVSGRLDLQDEQSDADREDGIAE